MSRPSDTGIAEALDPFAIDLRLHLERLGPGEARVERRVVTERAALGALLTCYRATALRVDCRLANPFAHPMRIAEIAARLDEFEPSNVAVFQGYRDQFAAEAHVSLAAPAYDLGEAGMLVLDRTHRLTALYMASTPFSVELVVLVGPVDRRILIDLKHWDGGWRRFVNRRRPG